MKLSQHQNSILRLKARQKKTKTLAEAIGGQFGSFGYDAPVNGEDIDPAEDIENFDSVEAAKQIMNLVDTVDIDGLAQIYQIVTGADLNVANNFELARGTGEKEAQEIADTIEHMSKSDVKYIYDELREQGLLG